MGLLIAWHYICWWFRRILGQPFRVVFFVDTPFLVKFVGAAAYLELKYK
jgi:hypothetical protein